MRLCRSLRVTTMMALVGMIPSLAALWFAAGAILSEVEAGRRMDSLAAEVGLTTEMSYVIHELQRERGATSIFVSSDGATFRRELSAQRAATDARREALARSFATVDRETLGSDFVRLVETVGPSLDDFAGHRAAVDALSVDRLARWASTPR
jgi:hypothetical protein